MENIQEMFNTGISLEPKLLIRLKHKLSKVGIKKVLHQKGFDKYDCYDNLTLLINPSYNGNLSHENTYYSLRSSFRTALEKMAGNMRGYYIHEGTKYTGKGKDISLKIGDENIVIGSYLKEQNIIILYFDIFTKTKLELLFKNDLLFFFIDGITEWIVKNKIKKINSTSFIKENLIKKYSEEITEELKSKEKNIIQRKRDIKSYESNIITYMKRNIIDIKITRQLEKMEKDILRIIEEQMKEMRELPFVKKIELTAKGIKIDVGKIYIKYCRKNIYIGDFDIYILPNKINIENRKKISRKDNPNYFMSHPHIDEVGGVCFGEERYEKILEYLGKHEYKKVMFMVYLFLKSYTGNDNHYSINHWIEAKNGISYYTGCDGDDDEEGGNYDDEA